MHSALFEIAAKRRSVYALGKDPPLGKDEVSALVERAVALAPSAYDSRSSRVLIMHGAAHLRLWEKVLDIVGPMAPDAEARARTEAKVGGFKAAEGTICFFEDQATVRDLQARNQLYRDVFPVWSLQSSGMLQYLVWTALAEAGAGASLQHYNPLIDDWLAVQAGLPPDWKLLAQMPYGRILAPPAEKAAAAMPDRVRSIG